MSDQTPRVVGTSEEQLALWIAGESVHTALECCPDFSCCRPTLLVDVAIRRAFVAGSRAVRNTYLGPFLAALIADAKRTGEIPSSVVTTMVTTATKVGLATKEPV